MMRITALLLLFAATASADPADDILSVWDKNKDGILTKEELPDQAIFKRADADADGKLTRIEIAAYLRGEKPKAKTPKVKKPVAKKDRPRSEAMIVEPRTLEERIAAFFRNFDKNKDGKIQKAEFRAGDEVFAAADSSRNNELSRREVKRYIRNQLEEARKRPNRNNFFNLFDMNRDKKVTKREYTGPPKFFRDHDHNKDRVVDQKELNLGPSGGMVRKGDKEFLADGPTTAPRRGLLERYDADKNGRVTLEELKGAKSVMERLDKNGDGVLSGSEVR